MGTAAEVKKRFLAAGRRHGIGSISFFHSLQRITTVWFSVITSLWGKLRCSWYFPFLHLLAFRVKTGEMFKPKCVLWGNEGDFQTAVFLLWLPLPFAEWLFSQATSLVLPHSCQFFARPINSPFLLDYLAIHFSSFFLSHLFFHALKLHLRNELYLTLGLIASSHVSALLRSYAVNIK